MRCDLGINGVKTDEFWINVFAEFLSVFFFTFMVCGSCIVWDSAHPPAVQQIALCAGLAIATWAMTIGHWSGGHINPAVTVGFLVTNKIAVLQGVFYIVAQFFGGIAGSAMLYGLTPEAKHGSLGATTPGPGVSPGQAFGIEFVLTFVLVLTVFATTDPKRMHYGYEVPLAIGLCIAACHLIGVPFTGCGINPARSFGPAVIMNIWTDHWVYWAGPVGGGILAALLYQFVFRAREEQGPNANKPLSPDDVELQ